MTSAPAAFAARDAPPVYANRFRTLGFLRGDSESYR